MDFQRDQNEQSYPQSLHHKRRTTSQHLLRLVWPGLFSAGLHRRCIRRVSDTCRLTGVRLHSSLRAHVPEGVESAPTFQERWEETSGEVVLLFLMIRLLLLVLRIFAGKRQEVRLCC